jgi:hypothetical protein
MKLFFPTIQFLIVSASLVHAQAEVTASPADYAMSPITAPATAHILGDIPDGTQPAPAPPKPEFRIPSRDILRKTTHGQGGRTITIQQIKAIALPPLAAPFGKATAAVKAEFSQRLTEYREENPKSGLLFLGATVFRSKDSPPRTLVRYWPEKKGKDVAFWSSADFALIAGGINSFVDSSGDAHYLLMGWDEVDVGSMAELNATKGREYDAPALPEFAAGKATFQITGEQPAAEDLVVIQSLHDLYHRELVRLRAAYKGRELARIQNEEYLKANPPQPKDITLNFWRTERPSSEEKGASSK